MSELTPFQLADLDRLLCERLGIAPTFTARHDYWDEMGNLRDCICGATHADRPRDEKCPARCDSYPTLSTSGHGMLTLMLALAERDHYASVAIACVGFEAHCVTTARRWEVRNDSAPLALALAAAAALGIEVPE